MSVVYVQNPEAYINYRAMARRIHAEFPPGGITDWHVKTGQIALDTIGPHKIPLDTAINECYLWHGTTPENAESITDTWFDISKTGSSYGSIFGPGIYFAESCLKADEYVKEDSRKWFPLVLSRVLLGNVYYCDEKSPWEMKARLEAACKGGGYHSILGDREKVRRTFREFILFNQDQIYPEYLVWYKRR